MALTFTILTVIDIIIAVIFFTFGYKKGEEKGIDEVFDIFEQLEFTDEQINKMNKLFMKEI
jgi:nicotinic acid phosphoribosyltransferase